ncbi:MAG: hypothetical protein EZS28_037806 [Streblomastix strix]|uniref:Uncharacterized protein n=1 Tax=Streblomastix strix TaxID=222440 RepID=A0A5J4U8J3_9EUKA|nr:MAG: hypothetical protein EZS28_037806 [Streblomastix strix]
MPRETVETDVDENQIEGRGCFDNDRKKLIDIEDIKVNERSLLVYDNVLHNCIEKLYRWANEVICLCGTKSGTEQFQSVLTFLSAIPPQCHILHFESKFEGLVNNDQNLCCDLN